jgi:hypothetical protein
VRWATTDLLSSSRLCGADSLASLIVRSIGLEPLTAGQTNLSRPHADRSARWHPHGPVGREIRRHRQRFVAMLGSAFVQCEKIWPCRVVFSANETDGQLFVARAIPHHLGSVTPKCDSAAKPDLKHRVRSMPPHWPRMSPVNVIRSRIYGMLCSNYTRNSL